MAFRPFSLSKAINDAQTMQFNKLKLATLQDGIDRKRDLRQMATEATRPTYGRAEGPPTQTGEEPEIQTGTEYDPQAHQQKLMQAGEVEMAGKIQDHIGKMQKDEREDYLFKAVNASRLMAGVKDEETYDSRQQEAIDQGWIKKEDARPFSPENLQMIQVVGRAIEDIYGSAKSRSSRGGYTTLVDVVMPDEKGVMRTYKIPFDHREGKYKYEEKQLLSPKDPTQQAAVTGAKKVASVVAKERTAAKIDLPKVESNAEQLKTVVQKVLDHPGFSSVVGAPSLGKVTQYIGGTEAAGFKSLFDQLKGKQFSQAYETLKGGGQITEIEGVKATNALSTLRTSVSEKEFIAAAKTFLTEIDRLTEIARERSIGKSKPTKLSDQEYEERKKALGL